MKIIQTIDQVHVLRSGDGWRGWNEKMKLFRQLIKFAYFALVMDEEG